MFWKELRADIVEYFQTLGILFRDHRRAVLLAVPLIVVLGFALLPYDQTVRDSIQGNLRPDLTQLALYLRKWGDFRDTITVTILISLAGWIFHRRSWRRIAVVFFLSATLAGISVNILRFTTGRPRPYVDAPDRLYGPSVIFQSRDERPGKAKIFALQSFPSGHSGTSSGGALSLLIAAPPIGIPMMFSAGGVIWSSLYYDKHYLTDVAVGTGFGIIFGTLGGLAYRRMKKTD